MQISQLNANNLISCNGYHQANLHPKLQMQPIFQTDLQAPLIY